MPGIDVTHPTGQAGIRANQRVPASGFMHLRGRFERHWPVLVLLGCFWLAFPTIFYVLAMLDHPAKMPTTLIGWISGIASTFLTPVELAICGLGVLSCLAIYFALSRFAASSLRAKIVLSLVFTILASVAFALANTYELALGLARHPTRSYSLELIRQIFLWIAPFGVWTGMAMILTHSRLLRDQQERLATLRLEAQQAQLRALRYQLSPHFLFNTLNSISWMVWEKEWQGAEAMIVNFSDFLRTTLALDPSADVPLRDEISLQRKYLSVEQVRFADRLRLSFNVPASLEAMPVPALILQPLVENAIKHAVAPSSRPVMLAISASRRFDKLLILVEDDGTAGATSGGFGLGLANVRERLSARYGAHAGLETNVLPRGFRAILRIPID